MRYINNVLWRLLYVMVLLMSAFVGLTEFTCRALLYIPIYIFIGKETLNGKLYTNDFIEYLDNKANGANNKLWIYPPTRVKKNRFE